MPFGPNLGMSELIVILAIVMLIFGASRLPQLGEGMGKAIRSFKRGLSDDERIEVDEKPASKPAAKPAAAQKPEVEAATDAEVVEKS